MIICPVHNKEYLDNLYLCSDCILEQRIIINNGILLFNPNSNDNQTIINESINDNIIIEYSNENEENNILVSPFLNNNSKIELFKETNKESNKETICNICLLNINYNDIIRILNCNHLFHIKCIDKWFEQKSSCPLCRNNLYKIE